MGAALLYIPSALISVEPPEGPVVSVVPVMIDSQSALISVEPPEGPRSEAGGEGVSLSEDGQEESHKPDRSRRIVDGVEIYSAAPKYRLCTRCKSTASDKKFRRIIGSTFQHRA